MLSYQPIQTQSVTHKWYEHNKSLGDVFVSGYIIGCGRAKGGMGMGVMVGGRCVNHNVS